MICFRRICTGTLMILGCLILPIYSQDTTGFIDSLSYAKALNPQVEWRKSWFSGEWYNLSFTDNFSFVYNYFAPHPLPAYEDSITIDASGAAMKDLHTHIPGPRFVLLGYIAADQMWCIIPAVLSPDNITIDTVNNTCYVDESWYSWR